MKTRTEIIFRADGNSQIGLGHVMRALALAEMLQADFDLTFAIKEPTAALEEQLKTVCQKVIKLPETALLAEAETFAQTLTGNEILVLDGYQFTSEYQQILKQKGNVLVFIDDLHDRQIPADVILNSAGGLTPDLYQAAPYTRFCLGPDFALLRKPFREVQKPVWERDNKLQKLLICFGGADPENFTLAYARQLADQNTGFELEIVTGSAYRYQAELREFLKGKRYANWHQNLSAAELAHLMQQCAVALCSASVISYEYCAVNGMLFVLKTAGNQADLYRFLLAAGLAIPAEDLVKTLALENVAEESRQLQQNQREYFQGQAEDYLRKLFNQLSLQAQLIFRKFTLADAELLYNWANDPMVRQFSFNPAPIPYETHLNWVQNKLQNPAALLLMAEIQGEPAAHLRFDRSGNTALISYQIGAAFRGKGLGHRVLQIGLLQLKHYFPEVTEAIGFVQPENIASVRAFEKAEFENMGTGDAMQPDAYKFRKDL